MDVLLKDRKATECAKLYENKPQAFMDDYFKTWELLKSFTVFTQFML